jgi:putative transposase
MDYAKSVNHTMWDCKYHLVWIPKYRKKVIYGNLRKYLGEIIRELTIQKECKVHEGHLMGDHIHILVSIPPKYAVSQVADFIKGKSAIHIARDYAGCQRQFYRPKFLGKRILCLNSWSR